MNRQFDVIIVGGGIIGTSIALRLAQSGLRVSVLDRGEPGAEASSAAAGMIAPQGEKIGSEAFSKLCWASHGLYPEFVAEIEEISGVDTGYRRNGTLLLAFHEDQAREMDHLERVPSDSGGPARGSVETLSARDVKQHVSGVGDGYLKALFLPADDWVDNERLMAATIEAARRFNVVFVGHRAVDRLVVKDGRVMGVEAAGERFGAREFILSAGAWSGELARSAGLEIPTVPCRGQMLEFELASDLKTVVRAGHHYVVPRAGRRAIAGTTGEYAGFEKTVTAAGIASILQGTLRLVPFLANARFVRAWAGLRPDTPDHLPVLGTCGIAGLTIATGHFRNGILLAPVTARLIAELVLKGSPSEALWPFRADRFMRETVVH